MLDMEMLKGREWVPFQPPGESTYANLWVGIWLTGS